MYLSKKLQISEISRGFEAKNYTFSTEGAKRTAPDVR